MKWAGETGQERVSGINMCEQARAGRAINNLALSHFHWSSGISTTPHTAHIWHTQPFIKLKYDCIFHFTDIIQSAEFTIILIVAPAPGLRFRPIRLCDKLHSPGLRIFALTKRWVCNITALLTVSHEPVQVKQLKLPEFYYILRSTFKCNRIQRATAFHIPCTLSFETQNSRSCHHSDQSLE